MDVGTDTLNAMEDDQIILRSGIVFDLQGTTMSMEFLTNMIYKLIALGAPARLIIFFYSAVLFVSLFVLCKRYKLELPILMLLFLICGWYMYSFNIARQMCAMVIAAIAISFIFEDNVKKSLLYFLFLLSIAIGLHFSSIYVIILYVFRWIKLNKIIFPILISLSLPVLLDMIDIRNALSEFMNLFYMGDSGYTDTYADNMNVIQHRSFNSYLATFISVILYIIILYKITITTNDKKYIPLFGFSIFMNLFRMNLESVIARSLMYFGIILLVMSSIYFSEKKYSQPVFILFVIFHSVMFLRSGLTYDYTFDFHIFNR